MAKVGGVEYEVKIDDSNLDQSINTTSKKVSKFGQGLQTVGSVGVKAVKGIANAYIGLVSAAGAGIAAVAKMGIEYNSQIQSYETAFKTMLGDAEKATALTEKLRTMAAETPLAMTDLADASKVLLAFGSSAEELPDQLKRLGDVAQGNAQALGTMATAFGRIQSNGYASLEEINMMIDQGFNPLQLIAEKTGESMGELRDRVSAGEVSFEELNEALITATSSGGQFYNAMLNQSKTFEGQISTLKDNVSNLSGILTQNLFANLAESTLPQINSWIDQLTKATEDGGIEGAIQAGGSIVAEAITGIAKEAPKFIDLSTDLVQSFLDGIQDNSGTLVNGAFSIVNSLIDGLIQTAPSLVDTATDLIHGLLDGVKNNSGSWIEGAFSIIGSLAQGLIDAAPDLVSTAGSLIANLINGLAENLPQIIQTGIELVISLVAGIIQALPEILAACWNLITAITSAFTEIDWASVGQTVLEQLGAALSAAWEFIKSGAANAIGELKSKWEEAGSIITQSLENVRVMWETIWQSISDFLSSIWNDVIIPFFQGIWESLTENNRAFLEGIFNAVSEIFTNVKNFFVEIWTGITMFLLEAWQKCLSTSTEFLLKIYEGIKNKFNESLNIVKSVFSLIWNTIKEKMANVLSTVMQAVEDVKSKFLNPDWGGIGGNIISGIAKGIGNAVGGLVDAAVDAARRAFEAAKNALGIHSPSKKFAWIGEMSGEGWTEGMDEGTKDLDSVVQDRSAKLLKTAEVSLTASVPSLQDYSQSVDFQAVGGSTQPMQINVPLIMDGREVARATAYYMGEQLEWEVM